MERSAQPACIYYTRAVYLGTCEYRLAVGLQCCLAARATATRHRGRKGYLGELRDFSVKRKLDYLSYCNILGWPAVCSSEGIGLPLSVPWACVLDTDRHTYNNSSALPSQSAPGPALELGKLTLIGRATPPHAQPKLRVRPDHTYNGSGHPAGSSLCRCVRHKGWSCVDLCTHTMHACAQSSQHACLWDVHVVYGQDVCMSGPQSTHTAAWRGVTPSQMPRCLL